MVGSRPPGSAGVTLAVSVSKSESEDRPALSVGGRRRVVKQRGASYRQVR